MMFSIEFDEKIVKKKIRGAVRDNPPDDTAKIPDGAVALTQSEDLKFLAGINHNTPFIFLHHINIMHDMLIACKELHWSGSQSHIPSCQQPAPTLLSLVKLLLSYIFQPVFLNLLTINDGG